MTPIAKIVCWHCRKGDKQLFRIKDEDGFKTEDYICVECKPTAPKMPPIGNASKLYYPTKEQLERIAQIQKDEKKVVAVEGDPIPAT